MATSQAVARFKLRPTTAARLCAAAMRCSTDRMFTLDDFAQAAWGRGSGKILSGAGRALGALEQLGLVRKLGKNAYGTTVYDLTEAGALMGSANRHEVVETFVPPTKSTDHSPVQPVAPATTEWIDAHGVRWVTTASGTFWFDQQTGVWVPAPANHGWTPR